MTPKIASQKNSYAPDDSAASPRARAVYENLRLAGRPFFAPGSTTSADFLAVPFVTVAADQQASGRRFETVTDHNMITEFRYGRALYYWSDLFAI